MDLPREIETELEQARRAREEGNDGKARVCARRAVGKAFMSSQYSGEINRSLSATQCLRMISENEGMPAPVREAAVRLSTGVAERTGAPVSTQPLEDALVIIARLFEG